MDDCKICQNEEICKWCSEMERAQKEANNISFTNEMNPILVSVKCTKFQKKYQKQDGLFGTR